MRRRCVKMVDFYNLDEFCEREALKYQAIADWLRLEASYVRLCKDTSYFPEFIERFKKYYESAAKVGVIFSEDLLRQFIEMLKQF